MSEQATVLNAPEDRHVGQSIWRGTLCRCPHCGKGKLFRSYLNVADQCASCGEELKYHRADDFPPYIAITIVGHVIIFLMMHMDMEYQISPMFYLLTMIPLAIVMSLALLPPIKGAIVGWQWASRMYGFGAVRND
jgi:uncharacterized protein (DUF983 family)